MATNPDAFFSFSYPPDTFMVTGQAQQLGFSPDVFYVCIGGVFPGYRDQFGADKVEGIFAYGGQDPSAPGYEDYAKAMKAMYNQEPEAGAVQVYACLQVVQQAIEKVGEIDRKKIRDEMAKGGKDTLWGDITWKDQLNASPVGGRPVAGRQDGRGLPRRQAEREAAAVPEAEMGLVAN